MTAQPRSTIETSIQVPRRAYHVHRLRTVEGIPRLTETFYVSVTDGSNSSSPVVVEKRNECTTGLRQLLLAKRLARVAQEAHLHFDLA
jgi:hypothetical protein